MQYQLPEVENSQGIIELRNNIRDKRSRLGMSQEELTELISVTGNTMSCMINAETVMKADKLFRIVDALQTTPDTLCPERFYRQSGEHRLDTFTAL